LRRAAEAEGIDLIAVDNRYSSKTALRNADLLVREKVDLVIEYQIGEEVAPIVAAKYRDANIPMIAIDIPHPGATFYGANNYEAGLIGGKRLGRWAKENWQSGVDEIILLELRRAGNLPRMRLTGMLMGIRHKLVEIRTRIKNGLQHLALNRGMQKKRKLWTEAGQKALRELPLESWAACRREDLLGLLASLEKQIDRLDVAVKQAADEDPQAALLMTQPGVGPITALAFVLTLGDVARFKRGKQVASYLGLIPREHSSGGKQRLGAINKQGNSFVRMLLVESAQTVTRLDEGFRKQYLHRCHRMAKGVAKVAAARRLAVRLYWMLRTKTGYPEIVRIESSPTLAMVDES
jgi:hypothetical protein